MILDEGYLYGPSHYRGCQPGFVGVEKHGYKMVALVWIDNMLLGRSIVCDECWQSLLNGIGVGHAT